MQKNGFARGCKSGSSRSNTAEHAVLIADRLTRQIFHTVALFLPADDAVKICIRQIKVAKMRFVDSRVNCFLNGRKRREVHVGHPHRDAGEALFDFRTRNRDLIDSDRIVAAAVHQRCKIVFHW